MAIRCWPWSPCLASMASSITTLVDSSGSPVVVALVMSVVDSSVLMSLARTGSGRLASLVNS